MRNIPDEVMLWITLSRKGRISSEEESMLKKWLDEHPESIIEAEDIVRLIEKAESAGVYHGLKVDDAWQKVGQQITGRAGWIRRRGISYWKVAAAIVLPLAIAVSVLLYWQGKEDVLTVAHEEVIRPGKAQAELWLANGEKIALKDERQQKIVNQNGQIIGVDSSHILICQTIQLQTEEWNTLKVPVGGEYQLILSDGTKIWVNAGSEVRFPVKFHGKEREIYLKGEAYFQVSPDHKHPFIVRTPSSGIRVLGTSFNVSCYEDEETEQTTLVEGKVRVIMPDRVCDLCPGKLLELKTKDRSVILKDVDVTLYTSWKDGIFRFCDMPLEELTVKLQRWYNVNFFFLQSDCREVRFTGAIHKYTDFYEFIRLVEKTTNVKFNIKGNTIIVCRK